MSLPYFIYNRRQNISATNVNGSSAFFTFSTALFFFPAFLFFFSTRPTLQQMTRFVSRYSFPDKLNMAVSVPPDFGYQWPKFNSLLRLSI